MSAAMLQEGAKYQAGGPHDDAGCTDAAVVEMWVARQAAGSRPADLQAAIAECDRVFALRPEPSDVAWASLAIVRDHLAGRLGRMIECKRITPEGKVVPMRRNHPGAAAHRVRPLRFVRT